MLALVIWLRLKFKDKPFIQMATGILGPACTMAIVWGFVYGEFFGNLLDAVLDHRSHISSGRAHSADPPRRRRTSRLFMIGLSLAMGLHPGRVRPGARHHQRRQDEAHEPRLREGRHARLPRRARRSSDVAAGPRSLAPRQDGQSASSPASPSSVGLYYALKGGKALGLVESISLITSVASYIRIMALGLAGAIFADAVNSLAAGQDSGIARYNRRAVAPLGEHPGFRIQPEHPCNTSQPVGVLRQVLRAEQGTVQAVPQNRR